MSAAIIRPNGKTYKPRTPPRTEWMVGEWGDEHPVITRTTDVCEILALLAREGLTPTGPWPSVRWLRLGMNHGERWWFDDPIRGVPATVFGYDNCEEFWGYGG